MKLFIVKDKLNQIATIVQTEVNQFDPFGPGAVYPAGSKVEQIMDPKPYVGKAPDVMLMDIKKDNPTTQLVRTF